MTKQLEATLGALKDVSVDAVGAVHHGLEALGETLTDGVGQVFGHEPPPSHKRRWAGIVVAVGAVILVLVILRNRRMAAAETEADRRDL